MCGPVVVKNYLSNVGVRVYVVVDVNLKTNTSSFGVPQLQGRVATLEYMTIQNSGSVLCMLNVDRRAT